LISLPRVERINFIAAELRSDLWRSHRLGQPLPNGLRIYRLRYFVCMASIQRRDEGGDAVAAAEAVRLQRLREDAKRPLSVNLAEGIALSHQLMRFTGAARSS
jgi:hypothetical protein